MQGVVLKAAAKGGIEGAREREPTRGPLVRRAAFRLDLGDDAPQTRHPLRSAAWRHSGLVLYVRSLFLFWTEKARESRTGLFLDKIIRIRYR